MRRNLLCSLVLLGIAGGYFELATRINRSALADQIGAYGLPYAYAALLALVAASLAISTLVSGHRAGPASAGDTPSLARLARSGGAVAIGVLYLAILPWAGYPIATVLLLGAMLRYLGEPFGLKTAAIAIGGTAFLWLLFDRVLGIALPGFGL